jgi:hypothetical protein
MDRAGGMPKTGQTRAVGGNVASPGITMPRRDMPRHAPSHAPIPPASCVPRRFAPPTITPHAIESRPLALLSGRFAPPRGYVS